MAMKGYIVVDAERCKGCALCVEACPKKCISLSRRVNGKGYCYAELAVATSCVGCTSCGVVCPDGCITVYVEDSGSRFQGGGS